MGEYKDLTGQRYGRLTVVGRGEDHVTPSGKHYIRWKCKCDCGNYTNVYPTALTTGATQSCGCLKAEATSKRAKTHGDTNTRLYGIWCAIKARCFNRNTAAYKDYGGRGITLCPEWENDFTSFKSWAYDSGYNDNLSIDRIDNNGDYTPDNCRWVTGVAQANNRRSNHIITHNGESHNITEWASIIGLNPKTLFSRIYSGWSIETALTK